MTKHKGIWIVNGILVGLLLIILLFVLLGGWSTTISLKEEGPLVLEYGEELPPHTATATFSGRFFLRNGISIPVEMDASGVGDGLGTYSITYSAGVPGASDTVSQEVQIVDTTAPEILLTTDPDGYTRPGETYQEEGFSASDACDGDLTDAVIRTETPEAVTYTVTDSSGNAASVIREIVYDDRVAPNIVLLGETSMTVEAGEPYVEPGYTATDDCDGDITHQVVIEEVPEGLHYIVTDSYGNSVSTVRTITYLDTQPPELTLAGEGELWVKAGAVFTDPGYSAVDMGDGDLTEAVTVTGEVDIYHAGDYTLTYTVSDQAGNTATLDRIIHVEPRPQPEVTSPGDKVVYLTFDDGPGAYTWDLLTVLYEYNVRATFFVTGANPDYYENIAWMAYLGHSVGLHTYSHVYEEIYASEEAYFEDLQKIQDIVVQQTGSETTLIRFPGGSSNEVSSFNPGIMTSLAQAVTDMGYQYFDWNVLSGDAGETTDPDTIAWNVCSGMSKNNVSIVLQHDIKSYSVEAVEMILAWGIENGYTFLPLTSTSPTAHHSISN